MKKTKIFLNDIINEHPDMDYGQLYEYIKQLINHGKIAPVKSAKNNGKKPALPLSFWKYEEEMDYTEVYDDLKYKFHSLINTEYYRTHPERYDADKHRINLMSDYLKNHSDLLKVKETMNERSFEIFHQEKFFQKDGGLEFCKRIGIDKHMLAFYETSEPLSYYSHSKQSPQNILIIENKDTFFDIRRYMNAHSDRILGKSFGTVIYGAGKGIWKTFADYVNGAESYFNGDNELLYFGDLDYEGIIIYEHLLNAGWENAITGKKIEIRLFSAAYEKMVEKAEILGFDRLPDRKEKQNTNIGDLFLNGFDDKRKVKILEILEAGKYIPQEILNEHDW